MDVENGETCICQWRIRYMACVGFDRSLLKVKKNSNNALISFSTYLKSFYKKVRNVTEPSYNDMRLSRVVCLFIGAYRSAVLAGLFQWASSSGRQRNHPCRFLTATFLLLQDIDFHIFPLFCPTTSRSSNHTIWRQWMKMPGRSIKSTTQA